MTTGWWRSTNNFDQVWLGSCRNEDCWYYRVAVDDLVPSLQLGVRHRVAQKITGPHVRRPVGTTLKLRVLMNSRAITRNGL